MNKYIITENKCENMHMFVWDAAGTIIFASNITYDTQGDITSFIQSVLEIEGPAFDDPVLFTQNSADLPRMRTDYYHDVVTADDCKIIADNNGIYKDNMRPGGHAIRLFGFYHPTSDADS